MSRYRGGGLNLFGVLIVMVFAVALFFILGNSLNISNLSSAAETLLLVFVVFAFIIVFLGVGGGGGRRR